MVAIKLQIIGNSDLNLLLLNKKPSSYPMDRIKNNLQTTEYQAQYWKQISSEINWWKRMASEYDKTNRN